MKRKTIVWLSLVLVLSLIPNLAFGIRYYSEDEYKKLTKPEWEKYWSDLDKELEKWNNREQDAKTKIEDETNRIEELKAQIAEAQTNLENVQNQWKEALNLTQEEIDAAMAQLDAIESEKNRLKGMSEQQLLDNLGVLDEMISKVETMLNTPVGHYLTVRERAEGLLAELKQIKKSLPLATSHTVVKGEFLYKISGYAHIYNDPKKWDRIYRANRDLIKDPNLIYPGWNLKIPQGLPTTHKVYKGESLWRISGYWEIYDDSTQWPRIYKANQDQIKDPDLIYPDQILRIPRD